MPNKNIFILPVGRIACTNHINTLDPEKKWRITVEPFVKKRTLDQNAFYHGVSLKLICEHTGYELDDMKMYLCGKFFGWAEYEMMGEKRKKPIKTTSQLNVEEFTFLIEQTERWAAQELDILIPKPNEDIR